MTPVWNASSEPVVPDFALAFYRVNELTRSVDIEKRISEGQKPLLVITVTHPN
jgi:hypothetical protein